MKPSITAFLFIIVEMLTGFGEMAAQSANVDPVMDFEEYEPRSTLIVPEHPVGSARFPFVDVHNHQRRMPSQDLKDITPEMDDLNMKVMVNLSGGSGENLKKAAENIKKNAPGRFILFANIDFDGIGKEGWGEEAADQLEEDYHNGARGLKIFKNLGLTVEDTEGERVQVDDPRLDSVWTRCAELGIPVLIHTGEPAVFWAPIDKFNERWLEMKQFPNRHRGDSTRFPSWETVMSEQWNLFRRHPQTTFINAHLGWMGNDLARLGKLLEEFSNVQTEIGAVLAELGRQPRFARQWLIKYQDRVMFGKDTWRPEEYHVYFRVLETADEYFDYYRKRHAFWKMYGLNLPEAVLEKLYYKNALRIIPGIDQSLFSVDN